MQHYYNLPYVRMCVAMLLLIDALHLGHQTFRCTPTTPAITLSTKNQITLCGFYVQLSAVLCEQLRCSQQQHEQLHCSQQQHEQLHCSQQQHASFLQLSIHRKALIHVSKIASYYVTNSISHQYTDWQLHVPSTMYQGIDEYFCDNVAYPDILYSRTNCQVILSGGWEYLLVNIKK